MASIKSFMKLAGEKFEVYRNDQKIDEVDGLPNHEDGTKRAYIGFYAETNIKAGDWVKGMVSNDLLYIEDIKSHIVQGKVFQIKGYYQTKKEYEDNKLKANQINRPSVIYNLYGANTRINTNSIDNSVNIVNMSTDDLFDEIRKVIKKDIEKEDEKRELREIINEMETSQGTKKFNQLYTKFITSAANHITVISPFIPALSQMIQD